MSSSIFKAIVWGLVLALAVLRPRFAAPFCERAERVLSGLARRRVATWVGAGVLVLLIRAALLPLWPIPHPFLYDEFCYLLQADTFSSGRLTNPTHPHWQFFETNYVMHRPSYQAKYPPGQGLVMAAGQAVTGDPWWGVWFSAGALMAALCWALQGWFAPGWALLGAVLAFRLCLFGYWMDSYWGGAVAAVGGALVIGAWPRIVRKRQFGYAWALGTGIVILANTRMFEGFVFSLVLLGALALRNRSIRVWWPIAVMAATGVAFLLVYNYHVTGNALRLPYVEHDSQYAYAPQFNFQSIHEGRTYRHQNLASLNQGWMADQYRRSRSWHLPLDRAKAWWDVVILFVGSIGPAAVLLAGLLWTVRDRRLRVPLICVGVLIAASLVGIIYYPHYAAPVTACVLILAVQCFRHLRQVRFMGRPVGVFLARGVPVVASLLLLASEGAWILRPNAVERLRPRNAYRYKIEESLREQSLQSHVIFVHYSPNHNPHDEWIYNRADIDNSDIVWAQDMGREENRKLMEYFKGRSFWMFQPDVNPNSLSAYSPR